MKLKKEKNFIHLYQKKKMRSEDIQKEIQNIQENIINKKDQRALRQNFDKESLKKKNFILTEGAWNRLNEIYNYIKLGINLIIEGQTGTSKTFSVETICEQILEDQKKIKSKNTRKIKGILKFSLSQDTKSSDLLGSFVGDGDSLSGLKFVKGKFVKAYEEGYWLLLDEINLASKEVLQSIEDAIDNKVLSL